MFSGGNTKTSEKSFSSHKVGSKNSGFLLPVKKPLGHKLSSKKLDFYYGWVTAYQQTRKQRTINDGSPSPPFHHHRRSWHRLPVAVDHCLNTVFCFRLIDNNVLKFIG